MRSTFWTIQLIFGLFLIGSFLFARYFWIGMQETYLEEGIVVGIGGMCLFWGIRECLGALSKQYNQTKQTQSLENKKVEGKE